MSKSLELNPSEIDFLLSPEAIRSRSKEIFDYCVSGGTSFTYHPENFSKCVDYVLSVIKKNYPDLKIPFHSRWGHFRAGAVDRTQELNIKLQRCDKLEKARCKIDLAVTSVLLDAGAGAAWKYIENGKSFSRSEGLGIASFWMFLDSAFSSDKTKLQADAEGLKKLKSNDLEKYFQVSSANPLLGVEGRLLLLNNLAEAISNKDIFPTPRPGALLDTLLAKYSNDIPATALLKVVLDGLGPIWPGRLSTQGKNLGDVWAYSPFEHKGTFASLIPIHKLSQWMTYSLIEPIEEAGIKVSGVNQLTGLAEYRNGGLMIDSGLLSLRNPTDLHIEWEPSSSLIVEWRALTLYLLDMIGQALREKLAMSEEDFPLAKALEGGTWWAGRFLAQEKREGAIPPLKIKSDGTVF